MSMHKSLKPKDRLKRHRNVLTRRERVKKLMEEGEWEEGEDSVFGLPKVKEARALAPATERKSDDEDSGEEEEAEETAEDVEQPEE